MQGIEECHVTKISYMENETETNFGWWTDKPERRLRPSRDIGRPMRAGHKHDAVWLRSALVIALVLTFGWALEQLAGW